MNILNIRQAEREGTKVIIGFCGTSGSGKTLTALYVARGMVDHPSEIGFLDTENKRGSLYADKLDGQFMIADLFAPFTPNRYAQAIKEFQAAGVKVLVIDSISHEWEGEGGCIDIADAPIMRGKKMADWKGAKSEHKKMMRVALQCDMHLIICFRASEKTDFSNPREPKSLGVQPICEKNMLFEMTASVMMYNQGSQQMHIKVPDDLKSAFGNGQGYIDQSCGQTIRGWVESGSKVDKEFESYKNKMQIETEQGVEHLKSEWVKMPKDIMTKMKPLWPNYEAAAQAFEQASYIEPEAIAQPDTRQSFEPVSRPAQAVEQPAHQPQQTSDEPAL